MTPRVWSVSNEPRATLFPYGLPQGPTRTSAGSHELHTVGFYELHTVGSYGLHTAGSYELHTVGSYGLHTVGSYGFHTVGPCGSSTCGFHTKPLYNPLCGGEAAGVPRS